jgi:hypothetical protein
MGKRVHVIKKHAEYGNSEAFNWKYEEFNDLLGNLGCDMCHEDEDYDFFECSVEDYKKALSLVNLYKRKGHTKSVEKKFGEADADIFYFEDNMNDLGGLDNILNAMRAFYRERDKKSNWISFSAW